MKKILFACLLVLAGWANAASVAIAPGVGVAIGSGGFTTASNFVGSFSAAAFNSSFTTQVAGKAVTMPATMRMAANAGQFAAAAVRLNPTALIGSAVATWLLTQGLEWANNQWNTSSPPVDIGVCQGPTGSITGVSQADCSGLVKQQLASPGYFPNCTIVFTGYSGNQFAYTVTCPGQFPRNWVDGVWDKTGVQQGGYIPATEQNWNDLAASPLPDTAAEELAKRGVPLPLQSPEFNPKQVDLPLGEPYIDPVTGKRFQDKARATPQPNGKEADVQVYKQEVDTAGNPVVNPTSGTPESPQEQTDPCKLNPDASGCKPLDEVLDTDLEKKENPFSLSPISGFGADNAACPAPQTLFSKGGQPIVWEWTQFCTFAQGIRPLIIGFAWLAAIAMVVAVGRRNG